MTAGNLVFHGNAMGEIVAYRATDGQKLWSAPTQAGVVAAPITYTIDGEQYVAIEVGWGGAFGLAAGELARDAHLASNIPRVLVFKVGGEAKLPEIPASSRRPRSRRRKSVTRPRGPRARRCITTTAASATVIRP